MTDLLCPFTATLVQNDFACRHAREIVRRGGAETACNDREMHGICCALHEKIKAAALEAMDLEDDLLSLPHSMLVKIQYGGLLGLQQAMAASVDDENRVADIASLVAVATEQYPDLDAVPYEQTSRAIMNYKLPRRSRK